MIRGKDGFAGATFTFTATLLCGLIAAGAMILAQMPWYVVLVLALVPIAVRLPGPDRGPVWLRSIVFSLYGFAVAALACILAWPPAQQT
jgi:hypothetical protein